MFFQASSICSFLPFQKSRYKNRARAHVNVRMAICVSGWLLDSRERKARIEITNVADFPLNDGTRARSGAPRIEANVTRWQVDAWYVPTRHSDRARWFVRLYSRERERGSIDRSRGEWRTRISWPTEAKRRDVDVDVSSGRRRGGDFARRLRLVNFVPRASAFGPSSPARFPISDHEWLGYTYIRDSIFPLPSLPFPAQQNSLSVCPFVPIC